MDIVGNSVLSGAFHKPTKLCCILPRDVRTNFLPTNGFSSKPQNVERRGQTATEINRENWHPFVPCFPSVSFAFCWRMRAFGPFCFWGSCPPRDSFTWLLCPCWVPEFRFFLGGGGGQRRNEYVNLPGKTACLEASTHGHDTILQAEALNAKYQKKNGGCNIDTKTRKI